MKFVKRLHHVPYETAFQRLRLFFLVRRRIRGDLICMYKITLSLLDFACDAVFAAATRIGLRGHALEIHQKRCKTRRRQHAFSVLVVPYWSKLPEEIMNAYPWRHSSCDWMRGGSPFSLKFPSKPFPDTPSQISSTCRIPPLCYYCNYSWSSIVVFTAHSTNKRDLI